MAAVGRYDGEQQMFVDEVREPEVRFLEVMRAKAQKEGRVLGPSVGIIAADKQLMLAAQKPGMYSKDRNFRVKGLSRS